MSKRESSAGNRLARCVGAPYRALRSARDFYIRIMTGCAGRLRYSGTAIPVNMSRNGSVSGPPPSSSDNDFAELVRAASQSRVRAAAAEAVAVRRSQSVAAVRIDEDAPYDFSGDVKLGGSLIFPRSRSHAVGKKTAPGWKRT